eukprot:TRINITY_DN48057_c0_g1_i1.p1 TRINITY_DN48057_c0_g1~~TRINITY_DN48057_c0_g1_i1.p1  ORF type:complete len:169 (-),score=50.78 TRINITY_DN48057_c0_g1_i1:109-615(-)
MCIRDRDDEIGMLRAQLQRLQAPAHTHDSTSEPTPSGILDQALRKPPEEACSQMLLSGDELQLVRLLNRLPMASVRELGRTTASELATRLSSLVCKGLFVEECIPWLQALSTSDKMSLQSEDTLVATLPVAELPAELSMQCTRLCEAMQTRRRQMSDRVACQSVFAVE